MDNGLKPQQIELTSSEKKKKSFYVLVNAKETVHESPKKNMYIEP